MIFEVDALKKLNKYTSVVYKLMLHNFHLPLKCKIMHKIKKVLISQSFKNPLNCQILHSQMSKAVEKNLHQISTGKITDHQNVV